MREDHTHSVPKGPPCSCIGRRVKKASQEFLGTNLSTISMIFRGQNEPFSAHYKSFSNFKENWLLIFMEEAFRSDRPRAWKSASMWTWYLPMEYWEEKTPYSSRVPYCLISVSGWLLSPLNWLLWIVFKEKKSKHFPYTRGYHKMKMKRRKSLTFQGIWNALFFLCSLCKL